MTDSGTERREPLILAGRYEVQVEIGSGAFATTWRGFDQRLGRAVAIKILHAHIAHDPAYVQRFEREAQAAAAVSHGNVVDIYDFGRQGDLLYIVMQYVAGEDLKQLILRERVLPADRARELVLQILAGLSAIHAAGIVHRDIKPQNVLVGNDGQLRVADFGIAHLDDLGQLTTTGTAFGTAAYMAPEQGDGRSVGPATDLYAVGVVLYELLTGTLPFSAPTPVAMMLAHIQQAPEPPSSRATRWPISGDLDAVVLQALQKHPEDRFRSAAAMSQALRNASVHGGWSAAQPSVQATTTSSATRPLPRPTAQGRPVPASPARSTPQGVPVTDTRHEGGGLSAVMGGFIALLLIVAAVGAFYVWQQLQDGGAADPTATPTATVTATATTTETTQQIIVPTDRPTDTPVPTSTPPPTSTSTTPPEPTATTEPTATNEPAPTEQSPTIEPIGPDATTEGGSGGGPGGLIDPAESPTPPA